MDATSPGPAVRRFGRHVPQGAAVLLLVGTVLLGRAWVPAALEALPFTATGPVYALPAVRVGLDRDPGAWLGRTLRVQGTLVPDTAWTCSHVAACAVVPLSFVLPGAAGRTTHLPVRWGPVAPLMSSLRRLSLVGRWVPPPQVPTWGTPAIYRVQVQPVSRRGSRGPYVIVVLDAEPLR